MAFLPEDIVLGEIIPRLSIDMRIAFGVPPSRLDKERLMKMEKMLFGRSAAYLHWYDERKNFVNVRKCVGDVTYSHEYFYGERHDEYVLVSGGKSSGVWKRKADQGEWVSIM